jgi:hypothetical protein
MLGKSEQKVLVLYCAMLLIINVLSFQMLVFARSFCAVTY